MTQAQLVQKNLRELIQAPNSPLRVYLLGNVAFPMIRTWKRNPVALGGSARYLHGGGDASYLFTDNLYSK